MKALLPALLLVSSLALAQEVTVSLTVDPETAVESAAPTLTWASTGAVTCTASGGWSGTKPTSGTETLPPINQTTIYDILCSAADGYAQLSWTAPTQYTNGQTIAATGPESLAGFKAFYGIGNLDTTIDIPGKTVTTYRIDGLTAGNWAFAMTAYLENRIESAQTNQVFKVVTIPASQASASAVIQRVPNPPVITTIGGFVYELRVHPKDGPYLARNVGNVGPGVPCLGPDPAFGTRLYAMDPASVNLTRNPNPNATLVAECRTI